MGHAYLVPEGRVESVVLGVCSSAEEDLMESLIELHGEETGTAAVAREPAPRLQRRRAR
jgi:hypothetical protein